MLFHTRIFQKIKSNLIFYFTFLFQYLQQVTGEYYISHFIDI